MYKLSYLRLKEWKQAEKIVLRGKQKVCLIGQKLENWKDLSSTASAFKKRTVTLDDCCVERTQVKYLAPKIVPG